MISLSYKKNLIYATCIYKHLKSTTESESMFYLSELLDEMQFPLTDYVKTKGKYEITKQRCYQHY